MPGPLTYGAQLLLIQENKNHLQNGYRNYRLGSVPDLPEKEMENNPISKTIS